MAEAAATLPPTRRATGIALAFGALTGVMLWQRMRLGFGGPSAEETSGLHVARLLREHVAWNSYGYAPGSHIPLHLLGVGEAVGGLIGARAGSALLGLCSLGFFFGGTRALFGSTRVAAWAALLLALQAPHLFLSQQATGDVVACCFFTGAMWLLIEGLSERDVGWLLCMLASVGFAISVLCKYVVVVQAPVLLLVVAVRRPRLLFATLLPCSVLLADYLHRHWGDLVVLADHQLACMTEPGAGARLGLLRDAALYVAPMLGLALASVAMQVSRTGAEWRAVWLHLLLLLLAVPLVAMHAIAGDAAGMAKHLVYPLLAMCPLAAWFLHRISRRSFLLPLVITAVLAAIGMRQRAALERSFIDLTCVVDYLRPRLGPTTTVLSEEGFLLRYEFPGAPATSFSELTGFDNDGDGRRTEQDAIDGIWDGKVEYVLVTGQVAPALVEKLRQGVLPHRYRVVLEQPYELSAAPAKRMHGVVQLWKRKAGAGGP
jgi:hypothetical protein